MNYIINIEEVKANAFNMIADICSKSENKNYLSFDDSEKVIEIIRDVNIITNSLKKYGVQTEDKPERPTVVEKWTPTEF